MNSMRRRLMVLLAVILLFFQLISVIWLWHESREQIGFLVNETLSAKARNNHVEKRSTKRLPRCWSLPGDGRFYPALLFWAVTDGPLFESFGGQPAAHVFFCQLRASQLRASFAFGATNLWAHSDMEEIGAVTTLSEPRARL